jgi:hypothetical protein
MNQDDWICVGRELVNLRQVSSVRWSKDVLYVNLIADKPLKLEGDNARAFWRAVSDRARGLGNWQPRQEAEHGFAR